MHHLAVADVHAHIVHPTSAAALAGEEQQVAGAQFDLAYLAAELALLGRIARQLEVGHIQVHAAHQPAAVQPTTVVAAVAIRHAHKLLGIVAQGAAQAVALRHRFILPPG